MSENLNHELPQELVELERRLSALAAAPARLDRDRLLFDAGVARGLARAPTVAAEVSNGAPRDPQPQENQTEPRATLREAENSWPIQETRNWKRMGNTRSWRLATIAATLSALLLVSLYVNQRNRPPVVVREIVTVERPALAAGPQVARTDAPKPATQSSVIDHSLPASSLLFSGIRPPAWLIPNDHASATSSPANYLALRHLVFTRGIDALPQPEIMVDSASFTPPRTAAELLKEFLPRHRNEASSDAAKSFLPQPANQKMGETI